MTDFDSIWRTQDEIRTVVNAVLGALGFAATEGTQECIWNLSYNERRMATADYDGVGSKGTKFVFYM